MTSIEQTVNDSLTNAGLGNYSRHAAPVTDALVEREREITDRLVALALSNGVINSEEQGKQIAEQVGLAVRPAPEPEAVEVEEESSLLRRLADFARQHGFRG